MSYAINNKAIKATRTNKQYATFITRYCGDGADLLYRRYAVIELSPFVYKQYQEHDGKWVECKDVVSFLVWNGEFQGYDDITSLIEEWHELLNLPQGHLI